MDLRDLIEAHKELITDRLDPDFGLLDELLASRSLTRSEVAKVKAVSDSYGRSEKLLEYVCDRGIYEKFLNAIKNTQQTHLANFILSNGERCPEFGDDWPLTEREISILDTNQRSLVDLLETCDLLPYLYCHKVVNNRQRDFVSSKTASHEKNDALLELLRRTSLQDYKKMIYCLHLSKQSHIADIFKEGGGVVRVRSELETESDVNEVEDELITKITEILGDHSLGDSSRILKFSELRLIAAKKGNSIILYFFYKTLAELVNLQEMQTSGQLAKVVKEVFNKMLSRAQVIILKTTLCDEDFSKCELSFREKAKMEDAGEKAEKQLREITECPICLNTFTDPRILQCIHTFCVECLKRTAEEAQKKPGDKMPCPLCRKEFTIPKEGIVGLQKNFFMENLMKSLLEFKTTLQSNHPTLKIRSETEEEIERMANVKTCIKHTQKPLDYYCAECKKIVCVSCFVEEHKSHDCKYIATVDEEFRHKIIKKALKISNCADEMLVMKENVEKRKTNFLKDIVEKEKEIHKRNQELKEMIDRDTKSLLDELCVVKSNQLKKIEHDVEITDTNCTILKNFQAYCNELISKGTSSDLCRLVDKLIARADELEKHHEAFIGRPHQSVEISFVTTDFKGISQTFKNNVVGIIQETTTQFENCAIVVGLNDRTDTITEEVVKINLDRPNEISAQQQHIPTMIGKAVAAVYCNTMYVTGIGVNNDEIWKYNQASGWMKCTPLVQDRRRHSAAFINEVTYCISVEDVQHRLVQMDAIYTA